MASEQDEKYTVFFDIDNTLYPASARISQAMGERIHNYFVSMGLPEDEASELHHKYYKQYGLALRGLVHHHEIDPLEFDRACDGSLPLEEMLRPDPALRQLLLDIDRSKTRVWALTNAYQNHAKRVLKILELDDLIEGIVFCDYRTPKFFCKPEPEFYNSALQHASITDPSKVLFVDDSVSNVRAAKQLGWGSCVWLYERGEEWIEGGKVVDREQERSGDNNEIPGVDAEISNLQELRKIWKHIFVEEKNTP
ncbi:pyrimidine 5-nucleotidase [Sistotremastrum niveocremeum HHB9708]|uniref:Pyrimidine 5-nucleotidase n=2 Tax=Sistotremastraceae TaxID=3402574 RepID=A0A164ZTD1_9AGAM|nr:pyrimidine 5-nucleotidase [Sistotremastrum niveocremeum HHB9708]KZT38346.1 pyrimidine 5-nucleotidase [Sistotremastrum suecicum HHB10207 ss-3]